MNDKKIIELYNSGHTLRHISDICNLLAGLKIGQRLILTKNFGTK